MKPERLTDHQQEIREVSFRRLTGELLPHPTLRCDVLGCEEPAICRVGCGEGHPSCEQHARSESYIFPLDERASR